MKIKKILAISAWIVGTFFISIEDPIIAIGITLLS